MQKNNINTILFDMDGVVIDSEKLHLRAMGLTLEKFGISYTQSFLNEYVGRSDESFFDFVFNNMDSSHEVEDMLENKNLYFEDLLKGLQYVDGYLDFMRFVKEQKWKTGLVTSSSLFTVNKVNELLNHTHSFDIIITEEDTQKHKPFPDPYILGLVSLDADKSTTLVIEDSINGIISGKAAGCIVAGITTSFEAKTLMDAGADFVVSSFNEIIYYIDL